MHIKNSAFEKYWADVESNRISHYYEYNLRWRTQSHTEMVHFETPVNSSAMWAMFSARCRVRLSPGRCHNWFILTVNLLSLFQGVKRHRNCALDDVIHDAGSQRDTSHAVNSEARVPHRTHSREHINADADCRFFVGLIAWTCFSWMHFCRIGIISRLLSATSIIIRQWVCVCICFNLIISAGSLSSISSVPTER